MFVFSLEFVSLCKKNNFPLLLLIICKLSYFIDYRCLNLKPVQARGGGTLNLLIHDGFSWRLLHIAPLLVDRACRGNLHVVYDINYVSENLVLFMSYGQNEVYMCIFTNRFYDRNESKCFQMRIASLVVAHVGCMHIMLVVKKITHLEGIFVQIATQRLL